VQDKTCEQFFCKFCIEKALDSSNQKCPVTNCSANFKAAKRISKVSQDFIDKARVKCSGEDCNETAMPVNEVLAHRRVCFVEKLQCIFGCGEIFKGKAAHARHATEDCPRVDTICHNCSGHSLK
jgi:hypothetical protein